MFDAHALKQAAVPFSSLKKYFHTLNICVLLIFQQHLYGLIF